MKKRSKLGNKKLINSLNTDESDYPGRNSDDFANPHDLSDEQFSTKIAELQTFKCPFIESELQNATWVAGAYDQSHVQQKNAHKHVESLEFHFLVVG